MIEIKRFWIWWGSFFKRTQSKLAHKERDCLGRYKNNVCHISQQYLLSLGSFYLFQRHNFPLLIFRVLFSSSFIFRITSFQLLSNLLFIKYFIYLSFLPEYKLWFHRIRHANQFLHGFYLKQSHPNHKIPFPKSF